MQTLQQAANDAADLSQILAHAGNVAGTLAALGVVVRNWRVNGRRVVLELSDKPPITTPGAVVKRVPVSNQWSRRTYAAEYDGVQIEWTTLVPVSGESRYG